MRLWIVSIVFILLLGCIITGEEGNVTQNVTQNVTPDGDNVTIPVNDTNGTNVTVVAPPPKAWETYTTEQFSFEYPVNMSTQESDGVFAAENVIGGQTFEVLIVMHYNTSKVHGFNQDKEFREAPSQATTTFLMEDMDEDPIHMLDSAEEIGETSEFSIGRDVFVSEVPFKIRFGGSEKKYTGYGLSMYVPERSLHVKMRVIALNSQLAEDMKDQFLLSFRLE
jgi:hypothetical protein